MKSVSDRKGVRGCWKKEKKKRKEVRLKKNENGLRKTLAAEEKDSDSVRRRIRKSWKKKVKYWRKMKVVEERHQRQRDSVMEREKARKGLGNVGKDV